MLKKIISLVSYFIPKQKKIVIISNTFSHGNSKIFYDYLLKKNINFKVFCLSDSIENNTIKFRSFYGLYHFFTSKLILSSHGIPKIKSKNQVSISFWHGFTIKSFGNLTFDKFTDYSKFVDYEITQSKFFNFVYSYCWNLKPNQFLEFGEPVYDFYNSPLNYLTESEENYVNSFNSGTVLYAPTYRDSKYSSDGGSIDDILIEFLKLVEKNKSLDFILSLHPYEKISNKLTNLIKSYKNISFSKIHTEKIMPFVNTVILDSSSLYFHSIYLKKNTIIFFPDIESYKKTRGLVYDNFEIIPKNLIFKNSLEFDNLLTSSFPNELETLRNLFFPNELINPNEKLLNFILKKLK